jgi:hypothetical protein
LRLGAKITPILDSVALGQWIVGYPPRDADRWVEDQSYEFRGVPVEDWLTNNINNSRSQPANPESVRLFLARNGTFREWDWIATGDALKSRLPDEVKKEIQRFGLSEQAQIYLLSVEDFYREWRLLESLSRIAGQLATSANALLAKAQVQDAEGLLAEIRNHHNILPRKEAVGRAPTTTGQFDFFDFHGVHSSANIVATSPHNSVPPGQRVRETITRVFNGAIQRVLRQGPYTIWWPSSFNSGPRIRIEARSILAVAYLALLANFSHGWKRCTREDCGNIFRVTDDKRKIFCSQYCGHLVNLREKRKTSHKRKSRK